MVVRAALAVAAASSAAERTVAGTRMVVAYHSYPF